MNRKGLKLSKCPSWNAKSLPDPRLVKADEVIPGLVEIVSAEGPIVCHRVYRIYSRAAGIGRVKSQVCSVLNRAMHRAIRKGLIEQRNEYGVSGQINQIVRKAGTSEVGLRERGDRTFEEIPPAEIGAVMNKLFSANHYSNDEELFRSVLEVYEIGRLALNIRLILGTVRSKYMQST